METILLREVAFRLKDICRLEMALRSHGFKNFSFQYQDGRNVLVFDTEEDALVFALKGILGTLEDTSVWFPSEIEFMIQLEKRLKSYSKCDEFYIRQISEDT